ncbi:hypothetical protein EDB19DRAFT_1645425, partial [Suillus lakei]
PTGSGRMFMFWIPLLFNDNRIILIITPLNILGKKTHNKAKMLGFPAYNLSAETATDEAFNMGAHHSDLAVLMCYTQWDIVKLKYHVITIRPEWHS